MPVLDAPGRLETCAREIAMRFSIKKLFSATAAIAATCGSLAFSNPLVADAYYTLCLAGIVLGFVASIAVQGDRRIFWLTFSIVVTACTWMTLYGRADGANYAAMKAARMETYSRSNLITTRLLALGYARISTSKSGIPFGDASDYTRFMTFMTIGHSSLALLFGWAAGAWARMFYRKQMMQSSVP